MGKVNGKKSCIFSTRATGLGEMERGALDNAILGLLGQADRCLTCME
jgi:hypothetical protein